MKHIIDVLGISVEGFLIVFAVLVVIMGLVALTAVFFKGKAKEAAPEPAGYAPKPETLPDTISAGEVKLYDTDDKTAALCMAIVADKAGIPLNELRFISIREKRDV